MCFISKICNLAMCAVILQAPGSSAWQTGGAGLALPQTWAEGVHLCVPALRTAPGLQEAFCRLAVMVLVKSRRGIALCLGRTHPRLSLARETSRVQPQVPACSCAAAAALPALV